MKDEKKISDLKVAFAHDWLVTYRGGEKVLEVLCKIFPQAPIYTLFYDQASMSKYFPPEKVRVNPFINFFKPIRKLMLPILPFLTESLNLNEYDLIISTSSCTIKGIIPAPHAKHLCYIHSPMRYIWDQRETYLYEMSRIPGGRLLYHYFAPYLRNWDVSSSIRVDKFVSNSTFVGQRIHRYYGREFTVIPPPISEKFFSPCLTPADINSEEYYIIVGAFVGYKRFDLAIQACRKLKRKLKVCGFGPLEKGLRRLADSSAASPIIEFHISPSDEELKNFLFHAKALIFPSVEDFGMIAIEAMACGTPVIAYRGGGALDFIQDQFTGKFFAAQTVDSLCEGIVNFEKSTFSSEEIKNFASQYGEERFLKSMKHEILSMVGASS